MGNVERRTYDQAGNLIESESRHVEPDGTISVLRTGYAYDARRISVRRRSHRMAPRDRRIRRSRPRRRAEGFLGIEKRTAYDSFQNRIRETQDAIGLAIVNPWTHDAMSRVVAYTDPTGQTSTYGRDGLGRLAHVALANGFTSTGPTTRPDSLPRRYSGAASFSTTRPTRPIGSCPSPTRRRRRRSPLFLHIGTRRDGINRLVGASAGGQQVARTFDSLGRFSAKPLGARLCGGPTTMPPAWWRSSGPRPGGKTFPGDLNAALSRIDQTTASAVGGPNGTIADFLRSGPALIGKTSFQAHPRP